jgi:hypothetical protein
MAMSLTIARRRENHAAFGTVGDGCRRALFVPAAQ